MYTVKNKTKLFGTNSKSYIQKHCSTMFFVKTKKKKILKDCSKKDLRNCLLKCCNHSFWKQINKLRIIF